MKHNNTQNEITVDQFLEIKAQNLNKFKEDWKNQFNKEDKNNQKMEFTMWEAMSNGY